MKLADTLLEELWFSEGEPEDLSERAGDSVAAKLAAVSGLKPFPVVAQRVLQILSNPDFRLVEVTTALEEDPALAAGVLRVANSAFFAGAKSCASIPQAFMRMGGMAVKESILSVAAMKMFPDVGGHGKAVRDHCAAVAAIVQALARDFAPEYTDGIFLCGLMHDVGKMLLIESGEFQYEAGRPLTPDTDHLLERGALDFDHAVLGGYVMKTWKIPDPVPKLVAVHHQPTLAYEDKKLGVMTAILRIADRLECAFRNEPENIMAFIEGLEDRPETAYAGIEVEDIRLRVDKLYAVRLDSLRMFGG